MKRTCLCLAVALFLALAPPCSAREEGHPAVRVLIIPVLETTLSSGISGFIQGIEVDFGTAFKKNQALVAFDCRRYKGELEKAEAEYEQARTILEVNQRLADMQSVSEVELAVARAKLKMGRAERQLRQIQVSRCVLKAPFSGKVLERLASRYEYVEPGQPLLKVIADSPLHLQLFVPSAWVRHIGPGTPFSVHMDETGKDYGAEITIIGARVDPVSQTLEVRGRITGTHPELLAGMSGSARFGDQ